MLLSWLTDGKEPEPVTGVAGGEELPPGQGRLERGGERVAGPGVPGPVRLRTLPTAGQVEKVRLVVLTPGGPWHDPGGAGRARGAPLPAGWSRIVGRPWHTRRVRPAGHHRDRADADAPVGQV